jgi:hypothetical protein
VIVLDLQPPTTTEPREPLARASSQDEVPAESNGHAFIIGGWVTTAGALALGATALGLGAAGIAARDDFVDGGRTNADQQDQAETLRTANVVVWVLAGAAGVAGVTLLVLGYSDGDAEVARRHPQPSMALELRPSGVTLSATF